MTFLLSCPNCGERGVEEFATTGEVLSRPPSRPTLDELTTYLYLRRNAAGMQREWWQHRLGCGAWFLAERDTRSNEVVQVESPGGGS
jgi:methylglutamate dehydrogenase subunit B